MHFPGRLRLPIALLTIWLLFGAAFIAIKVGVSSVPPLLFAGSRLLAAGAVLLAWSAWREGWRLRVRPGDLAAAAVIGLGLFAGGQGSVSLASQYLPAGLLAVLVTLAPMWIALISWLVLRQPVPLPALAGIVAAFAGVVFLASPASGGHTPLGPALLTVAGSLSWAAASVYGGRAAITRRPVVATGIQLVVGGGVQMVAGTALGEAGHLHWSALAGSAGLAWVFLLVGPSLIGFPLFTWLLATTAPAIANTQAYASPVVALVLGWLLLASPVSPATLVAAAVILGGVALIVTTGGRRPARPRAERRAA